MIYTTIFWFRRDLRIFDNHGLFHALKEKNVLPIFIFDPETLNKLYNKQDKRIYFIYNELLTIKKKLEYYGSTLHIFNINPISAFSKLISNFNIKSVYFNHEFEPNTQKKDKLLINFLESNNIKVYSYKDHVIFEKSEIVKEDHNPYTVFTPYSRKWKEKVLNMPLEEHKSEILINNFYKTSPANIISLKELGFSKTNIKFPKKTINHQLITNYSQNRDFPAIDGTSKLSVHLRFGTISIRQLVKTAQKLNEVYLNELIWREFYMMILWHFPHIVEHSFKKEYDHIEWNNNESDFTAWCNGKTGYPIVDAGMRELNETGFMHNRLRMITASFLTKHLLIDWRWGEAYFANKLLDYELSSNNGGWQWAASTGCDPVPYFRIFNPMLQALKYDPNSDYIRKWVPEFESSNYSKPIVEHKYARERALLTYRKTKRI